MESKGELDWMVWGSTCPGVGKTQLSVHVCKVYLRWMSDILTSTIRCDTVLSLIDDVMQRFVLYSVLIRFNTL